MNSKEKLIKTEKTARYYICKSGHTSEIEKIMFVIHGYAQLAKDFIKEFDFSDDENTVIVAPEGLSKFYFRNNIGASWMTKEDRQNEINDYVYFLEKVYEEVMSEFKSHDIKKYILGYSQGVHTAVRWFVQSKNHFGKLILCSSDFPKDADFNLLKEKLNHSEMIYIHGNKDEAVTEEKFSESRNLLLDNNIEFRELRFDGGHRVDAQSILEAIE